MLRTLSSAISSEEHLSYLSEKKKKVFVAVISVPMMAG